MKKLLFNALLTVCSLTFFFALSSCHLTRNHIPPVNSLTSSQDTSMEESTHYHKWNTDYSYDEESHWTCCKTCNELKITPHYANLHEFNECVVCKQPFGVKYEISSDGEYAIVADYYGHARKVRVAETYQGLPVQMICNEAFAYSYDLTTIMIPESVITIEDEAFRWCFKLTEVINYSPFITVEKGAETNGYVGFRALSCFNAGDIYQSEFINDNGFIVFTDGAEKLLVDYVGSENSLVIPNYITQIHSNAFEDCSFSTVIIPTSVTAIGKYAFKECIFLTEVDIPDSVVEIGDGAFRFCFNLHTLRIGNGVQKIGDFAFHACESLTNINIPEGITSIGVQTFMECESLTYIKIPDSVTTIFEGAFGNCKNLTSLLIGENITLIRYGAFGHCENLQTIFYSKTQENYLKITIETFDNQSFLNATTYFHLAEGQKVENGNYWYYDENGLPTIKDTFLPV